MLTEDDISSIYQDWLEDMNRVDQQSRWYCMTIIEPIEPVSTTKDSSC